mgnify:CR=1 FL=1
MSWQTIWCMIRLTDSSHVQLDSHLVRSVIHFNQTLTRILWMWEVINFSTALAKRCVTGKGLIIETSNIEFINNPWAKAVLSEIWSICKIESSNRKLLTSKLYEEKNLKYSNSNGKIKYIHPLLKETNKKSIPLYMGPLAFASPWLETSDWLTI